MTTSISNNAPPSFTPAASAAGNGGAATAGAQASTAESGGKLSDQVKLTDSALALQQAARPADGAVVDQPRIEQIRKAIADGSYVINADHIAAKMLQLEQQLHGTVRA
jgi:negative regulator of flagellin synthesis FlgM